MSELVSRLLAAIEAEERRANAMEHDNPDDGGFYSCPAVHIEPYGDLPWGEDACHCGLGSRRAAVLRLCRAHREIIDRRAEAAAYLKELSDARAQGAAVMAVYGVLLAWDEALRILAEGYGITEEASDGE